MVYFFDLPLHRTKLKFKKMNTEKFSGTLLKVAKKQEKVDILTKVSQVNKYQLACL